MRGGDILDQLSRAAPGTTIEYGRGSTPPRDLVQAMRPLVEAGMLHPTSRRVNGEMRFLVQRGSGDLSSALARRQSRGVARSRRIRKTSTSMVFDSLVRAARRGMPCPTNEELARSCQLSGKLAASYRMRVLVGEGKIAVEDHSPYGRRVVTILSGPCAGKATCEAAL